MRGGGGTTVKPLLPFSEDLGRRWVFGIFNGFFSLSPPGDRRHVVLSVNYKSFIL